MGDDFTNESPPNGPKRRCTGSERVGAGPSNVSGKPKAPPLPELNLPPMANPDGAHEAKNMPSPKAIKLAPMLQQISTPSGLGEWLVCLCNAGSDCQEGAVVPARPMDAVELAKVLPRSLSPDSMQLYFVVPTDVLGASAVRRACS